MPATPKPPKVPKPQLDSFAAPIAVTEAQLGFNNARFDPTALDYHSALGSTFNRQGGTWAAVEDYETGALALPEKLSNALTYMGQHGIKPILIAAYGPPLKKVATLTVAEDAAAHQHNIKIVETLPAGVEAEQSYVLGFLGGAKEPQIAARAQYYGTAIAKVNGQTIELGGQLQEGPAAHPTVALKAGDKITVHRLRYKPVHSFDINEPSTQAYLRYVQFLADQIAAHGCEGYVCLWNEPPWEEDRWDFGAAQYAEPPAGWDHTHGLAPLLQACLQQLNGKLPNGVRLINGATDKSGLNSILKQFEAASPENEGHYPLPTKEQIANVMPREGIHNYNVNPEGTLWNANYELLNPANDAGSNWQNQAGHLAKSDTELKQMSTECGTNIRDEDHHGLYLVRKTLASWGCKVIPIFYAMISHSYFTLITENKQTGSLTPRKAYYDLVQLQKLKAQLGGPGGLAANCPKVVTAAKDKWPVMSTSIYGANAAMTAVWQRTWSNHMDKEERQSGKEVDESNYWPLVPKPASIEVVLQVPAGKKITAQIVRTGVEVPVVVIGNEATVLVSDDPVAVLAA